MKNERSRALLEDAAQRGIAYRQSCDARPVAPSAEALGAISRFVEPLPENGTPAEEVLALLDEVGSPASVAMAGPRFLASLLVDRRLLPLRQIGLRQPGIKTL